MDSRLDSLFRTGFLPAQQTDTWLGIRQEEPRNDRRGKGGGSKEKPAPGDDHDTTTLSTLALHEFLKTLLHQTEQAQMKGPGTPAAVAPGQTPDPAPGTAPNPVMRDAARAYRTTARNAPGQGIDFTDGAELGGTQAPSPPVAPVTLSAEDVRTVRALLAEVEELGRRGIATIPLRPAENFLQSLVLGIREAAAAPG